MTSGVADTPRSGRPPAAGGMAWHTLGADQVLHSEGVDGRRGLSSAEAAARAQRSGPNKLAAAKAERRWHAFVRQYNDPMQLVLLAAGIGSLYPLKQLGTGVLLILLTLFNAVMNPRQEGKGRRGARGPAGKPRSFGGKIVPERLPALSGSRCPRMTDDPGRPHASQRHPG
jgi:hypothetical protein